MKQIPLTLKGFYKLLSEKFNLIDLIVNDFKVYMLKTQQFNQEDKLNLVIQPLYNHKINIEIRLEAIKFLHSRSENNKELKAKLSNENIETIWNNLYFNTEQERTLLFGFFLQKSENSTDLFFIHVSDYLFKNILTNNSKFDPLKITYIGYRLFKKYFDITNLRNLNFININDNLRTANNEIIGYNFLWDILTKCINENVRKEAAKSIISICINLKTSQEDFCIKIWSNFISKLLVSLQNAIENHNEISIKGVSILIKFLIKELTDSKIVKEEDLTAYNNTYDVLFVLPSKNEQKNISLGVSETILEVREKISYFFNISIPNIALKYKNKIFNFNDDDKIFIDFIDNNYSIEVLEIENPLLQIKTNPLNLIMDNDYIFSALFKLLTNTKTSYVEDIWEIINLLPKNQEMVKKIEKLGMIKQEFINWTEYLDQTSIYQMSYSIDLIKNCVIESLPNKFNIKWMEVFKENKGIEMLISLLGKFQVDHFSLKLGYKCIRDIIYLLNTYISVFDNFVNSEDIAKNQDILIQQIFYNCLLIYNASKLKDDDTKLIDLQNEFKRKRNKEQIHKNLIKKTEENSDENNTENLEEYHPTIRENWALETQAIWYLIKFLDNFSSLSIINNLIEDHLSLLRSLIVQGLIYTKNFRIKYSVFESISSHIEKITEAKRIECYCNLYNIFLDQNILKECENYPYYSDSYFKILQTFLKQSKLSEAILKNELLKINFKEVTDYMLVYIENYIPDINKIDKVLVGYLSVLRELILDSKQLHKFVLERQDILKFITEKCLFSKCKSTLINLKF